ncbi:MAG: hypothetical protein VX690_02675 [Pseudomonadota bacterium]|nr:hypothetical protein [Pseudomonadota bacterium]
MLSQRVLPILVLFFFQPPGGLAQNSAATDFNPRDLSGVWSGFGGGGGRVPFGPNRPPLTPEGEAKYLTHIPTRSSDPRVPAVDDPALSNDPTFECNPRGFPRVMFDTSSRTFEFIHIDDRVLQLLQRGRTLREFWMDGREIPSPENMDNIGPSWYGHSVAKWEGNELIVDTTGMDDRAWLDTPGHVKSFEARIQERYRKVDADTIELRMTLYDPTSYTAPWVSDTKIFKRESPERLTFFGWYGMFSGVTDLMCAPLNAVERQREGAY